MIHALPSIPRYSVAGRDSERSRGHGEHLPRRVPTFTRPTHGAVLVSRDLRECADHSASNWCPTGRQAVGTETFRSGKSVFASDVLVDLHAPTISGECNGARPKVSGERHNV